MAVLFFTFWSYLEAVLIATQINTLVKSHGEVDVLGSIGPAPEPHVTLLIVKGKVSHVYGAGTPQLLVRSPYYSTVVVHERLRPPGGSFRLGSGRHEGRSES